MCVVYLQRKEQRINILNIGIFYSLERNPDFISGPRLRSDFRAKYTVFLVRKDSSQTGRLRVELWQKRRVCGRLIIPKHYPIPFSTFVTDK